MVKRQLELSLGRGGESGPLSGRGSLRVSKAQWRRNRTHWWFDRMRQAVDAASEPPPAQHSLR